MKKARQKIPFGRWVQYGANGNHVKKIYKSNISPTGLFDEVGFWDELEQFLERDNVSWEYDYLLAWCEKNLFRVDIAEIDKVVF